MKSFIDFIKSQGVIGLAIAFIMGASITKLITSFVSNIISPIVALIIGSVGDLENIYIEIASTKILIGSFVSSLVDFLIITLIIYFTVKIFSVEKSIKKKNYKVK